MWKEAKSSGLQDSGEFCCAMQTHKHTYARTHSADMSGCRDQPRKQCCPPHPHKHQQYSHRHHHHQQQVLFLLASSPRHGLPGGETAPPYLTPQSLHPPACAHSQVLQTPEQSVLITSAPSLCQGPGSPLSSLQPWPWLCLTWLVTPQLLITEQRKKCTATARLHVSHHFDPISSPVSHAFSSSSREPTGTTSLCLYSVMRMISSWLRQLAHLGLLQCPNRWALSQNRIKNTVE